MISEKLLRRYERDLTLNDDDLRQLQEYLCVNPRAGEVIKNTNGVRKLRWAIKGKGKRGGARILYIDFFAFDKIYLLSVYSKSKKIDISEDEKKIIRLLVEELKRELRKINK